MQIDLDIPIPSPLEIRQGRKPLYPLGALPVGGSFFAIGKAAQKAVFAAKEWKRRHPGWSYATRKELNGTRIWRTA